MDRLLCPGIIHATYLWAPEIQTKIIAQIGEFPLSFDSPRQEREGGESIAPMPVNVSTIHT